MESRGNFEGLIAQLIATNQAQQVRHEQQMEAAAWLVATPEEAEEEEEGLGDLFPMDQEATPGPAPLAGRFGTAQLEDPNLTSALQQVSVVDGRLMDGVAEKIEPTGVPMGEQLDPTQRQDMLELVSTR
ncbi:hypothetical protein AAFF_G00379470 [Aldrovandia affinis]|uniref:Uncharacterized protein n=1 Tax=Aldrovandia affinis TaxID=143900 RepID=A0AAD7SFH1_9TELE|nr:hypothetical protein AAFF_G00379470 [Aldrovandia affinis]